MTDIEDKLNNEMMSIYHRAKKDLGYNANRFLQLLIDVGGLQAAKKLINKSGGTYGFEVLWEYNRLDLSVEALVLKEEYYNLFTDQERETCKTRLAEYGYKFQNYG